MINQPDNVDGDIDEMMKNVEANDVNLTKQSLIENTDSNELLDLLWDFQEEPGEDQGVSQKNDPYPVSDPHEIRTTIDLDATSENSGLNFANIGRMTKVLDIIWSELLQDSRVIQLILWEKVKARDPDNLISRQDVNNYLRSTAGLKPIADKKPQNPDLSHLIYQKNYDRIKGRIFASGQSGISHRNLTQLKIKNLYLILKRMNAEGVISVGIGPHSAIIYFSSDNQLARSPGSFSPALSQIIFDRQYERVKTRIIKAGKSGIVYRLLSLMNIDNLEKILDKLINQGVINVTLGERNARFFTYNVDSVNNSDSSNKTESLNNTTIS